MKFQLLCMFCVAKTGVHASAGDPMGFLNSVMAGAQKGLAVAEHRHAKLVKGVRQEAAAFLQNEAETYGKFLGAYSAEVAQAEAEVKDATRLAQAGVAKAAATSQKASDWKPNDPALKLRIALASQADFAQTAITRAEHKNKREAKEVEENIEETLEDQSAKLAYKVGDMTPLVDKAKQTLEAAVEKQVATLATNNVSTVATSNLTVLKENLVKATLKSPAKIAAANKKLQDFVTKTDKDVALEVTKLQKTLDEDDKPIEIKVKFAPAKAAPAPKAAPTIKKVEHTKVKDAASTVAVVPAKAAPASKPAPTIKKVEHTKVKDAASKVAAVSAKAAPVPVHAK